MKLLKLPLLAVLVIVVLGVAGILMPRGVVQQLAAQQVQQPTLQGTVIPRWKAPNFRLTDQFGKQVSFKQFRGRPVLLTFMQSHCTGQCPVAAETIHRTLAELGSSARHLVVLAVSADPEEDTPASARTFSRQHGMLHRWFYLMGSRRRLTPIWHAYHLYVAPANAPEKLKQAHTSATYLIDSEGRERVLMTGDPDQNVLIHDIRVLLGQPVKAPLVQAVPAAQVDHPAPSFALTELNGKQVSLQSLRGHPVLLNFWATWCTACRTEMPLVNRWYRQLRGQGFIVLGVDQQEGKATVSGFVHRFHLGYPIALDSSGSVSARYNVADLPSSILIDQQGTVTSVHIGILDPTYLTAHVAPLLRSK